MSAGRLEALHAALLPTGPGGDLVIERADGLAEFDHVVDDWRTCLRTERIQLSDHRLGPVENGRFTIAGTTHLLGLDNLKVEITFFLSDDADDPTENLIECLIEPANF